MSNRVTLLLLLKYLFLLNFAIALLAATARAFPLRLLVFLKPMLEDLLKGWERLGELRNELVLPRTKLLPCRTLRFK